MNGRVSELEKIGEELKHELNVETTRAKELAEEGKAAKTERMELLEELDKKVEELGMEKDKTVGFETGDGNQQDSDQWFRG